MYQLLFRDIFSKKRLRQKLARMSLDEDEPGVSFLMGIDKRTGVPYTGINEPAIAQLWMHLREEFQRLDSGRPRGNLNLFY